MSAAYSIYDILRALIVRAGWVEEQQIAMLASVDEMQKINFFGSLAVSLPCTHTVVGLDGRCDDCGRRIHPYETRPPKRGMRTW